MGIFLGLSLWHFKFFGGGDSKLLWLVSSAFPANMLVSLYALIALSGSVQALWALKHQQKIPYGLAIAAGTIITIGLTFPVDR